MVEGLLCGGAEFVQLCGVDEMYLGCRDSRERVLVIRVVTLIAVEGLVLNGCYLLNWFVLAIGGNVLSCLNHYLAKHWT